MKKSLHLRLPYQRSGCRHRSLIRRFSAPISLNSEYFTAGFCFAADDEPCSLLFFSFVSISGCYAVVHYYFFGQTFVYICSYPSSVAVLKSPLTMVNPILSYFSVQDQVEMWVLGYSWVQLSSCYVCGFLREENSCVCSVRLSIGLSQLVKYGAIPMYACAAAQTSEVLWVQSVASTIIRTVSLSYSEQRSLGRPCSMCIITFKMVLPARVQRSKLYWYHNLVGIYAVYYLVIVLESSLPIRTSNNVSQVIWAKFRNLSTDGTYLPFLYFLTDCSTEFYHRYCGYQENLFRHFLLQRMQFCWKKYYDLFFKKRILK